MKKIFKPIIVLVLMLFVAATSCKDDKFLNITNVPEFKLWKDLNSFEMAVAAPLNFISSQHWGGSPFGGMDQYSYGTADIGTINWEADCNTPWDVYYMRKHRSTTIVEGRTGSDAWNMWQSLFMAINACNDALSFIAQAEKSGNKAFTEVTPEVYDATMARMKAQLYFYRAFSYFHLGFYFCPPYDPKGTNDLKLVPFKTEFAGDPAALRAPELGSISQIYDLVLSDLGTAKSLMPKSYSSEGKPGYYTIVGMQVRLNFFMGKYTEAETGCTEIINNGGYSLPADVMKAWTRSYGQAPAEESIWEYSSNPADGNPDYVWTVVSRVMPWGAKDGARGANFNQCGWSKFMMSNSMLNYVDWMEDPQNGNYAVTANALADKRYRNLWYRFEGHVAKPAGMNDATYKSAYPDSVYQNVFTTLTHPHLWLDKGYRGPDMNCKYPLMRLPEFYLTRAIIRFNNNDKSGAAADLKVIRDRACPSLPSITSGTITADDIHRERVKELADEHGDRLLYLMSLRLPLGLADRKADGSEGVVVTPPYSNLYFRIPESEARNNEAYPKGWVQPN